MTLVAHCGQQGELSLFGQSGMPIYGAAFQAKLDKIVKVFKPRQRRPRVKPVTFNGEIVRSFLERFYVSRKKPALKPLYYVNRDIYWTHVREWFVEQGIEFSLKSYIFLVSFGLHSEPKCKHREIIMPFKAVSADKRYVLFKDDVAFITQIRIDESQYIREFHHVSIEGETKLVELTSNVRYSMASLFDDPMLKPVYSLFS